MVYEAYDQEAHAHVALKVLLKVEGEALLRFKKEFRALSDIHHPHLVRLGELYHEEGQWFFTMEMIRGSGFLDYVRHGPLSPEQEFHDAQAQRRGPHARAQAEHSSLLHQREAGMLGAGANQTGMGKHVEEDEGEEDEEVTQSSINGFEEDENEDVTQSSIRGTESDEVTQFSIGTSHADEPDEITQSSMSFADTTQVEGAEASPSTGPHIMHEPLQASAPVAEALFQEHWLRLGLRQLAVAIDALHQHGRVHRDIKPGNIMVDASGRIVLLDFGLIGILSNNARVQGEDRVIMGTPGYMAPEQVRSANVGPAADWYAFGVILFEALTGGLPFRGSARIIMEQKRAMDAPRPSKLVPNLPPDLDELCSHLLRREPEERPTGTEVLARLGYATSEHGAYISGIRTAEPETAFVGREAELAVINEVMAEMRSGGAAALLVRGEPGVGKSSLVAHVLDMASSQEPNLVLLEGRCYEQESVPFRGFDTIIDALAEYLKKLPSKEGAELVSTGLNALANLFPVLRQVPLVAAMFVDTSNTSARGERRSRAFAELKTILEKIAQRGSLVVYLDDLQWADEDSLSLLAYLLTPPRVPKCALIATMRAGDADGGQAALSALGDAANAFRNLHVHGLSREQAAELLAQLWKRDDDSADSNIDQRRGMNEALFTAILDEAVGHPLFLAELARWAPLAEGNAVGRIQLHEVLWQRIERLDADARRFIEYVALVGVPVPFHALAAVAGLEGDKALRILAELRSAQLVRLSRRVSSRLVEPYHDRVREAVRLHLMADPQSTTALHLKIGRGLLAHVSPEALDSEVFLIVKHLSLGVELMETAQERKILAELSLRAGRMARLATAYEVADEHIRRGLDLLEEDPWTQSYELACDLHAEMAEVEYLLDRPEDGAQRLSGLVEKMRTRIEKANVYKLKIRLDTTSGRVSEALKSGREGLALFNVSLPVKSSKLAVMREYYAVRWHQGRRSVSELIELPDLTDPESLAAVQLLEALTMTSYMWNPKMFAIVALRQVRFTLTHGFSHSSIFALAAYASTLATMTYRKYKEANAAGSLAISLADRLSALHLKHRAQFVTGAHARPWLRPYDEARDLLEQGLALSRTYGEVVFETYITLALAILEYSRERDLNAAATRIHAAAENTRRRKDVIWNSIMECDAGYVEAMRSSSKDGDYLAIPASFVSKLHTEIGQNENPYLAYTYYVNAADLYYLFGEYRLAWELFRGAEKRVFTNSSNQKMVRHTFLGACIDACLYDEEPSQLRRWLLRKRVSRALRLFQIWTKNCPENFEASYWIVAAEHARLREKYELAASRYELAANKARAQGATRREAVAMERAAHLARSRGQHDKARAYEENAIDAYRRWGAIAKAAHLETVAKPPQED